MNEETQRISQEKIQELINKTPLIDIRAALFKKGDFDFIVKGLAKNSEIVSIGEQATHEKQKQALQILTSNKFDEFLYGGAAGGAKTWTGVCWELFMCICYPGIKCFIARNELKDIIDSVFVTFNKVCREYGFTDFKFNAVKNFIQFGNGSHINFIELKYKPSDPMYEDVGSTEYTIGWIEEVGETNEIGATVISTRVGRHMNNEYNIRGTVLYTGNPKKNWAKREFYDKDKNGLLQAENKEENRQKKKYLGCLVVENPFIEEDYIRKLRNLALKNKAYYERLFKGNWDYEDNENALCDYEMIEQIFDNDHVVQGLTYITADVARFGSDKSVIGVWRGWRLIEILTFDISKTTEIETAINLLRRKYQIPKNRCIADEDGVGCLEQSTEVLTSNGWKKSIDITKRDFIVSKDEYGYKEHVKPFEIIHHEREKFIRINDDLAFTVSHAHFYKTRNKNKISTKYWDDLTEFKTFYNDTEITTRNSSNTFVCFDKTIGCDNGLYFEEYLFCSFLGWLLSDGYIDNYKNKNIIGISQSVKSQHNEEIETILNNMGVKWRKDVQKGTLNQYSFQHKNLFEWIAENCYVGKKYNFETKRLPKTIKDATKDCFMAFCRTFVNGDGYYHKGKMQFTGTNKTLLDEIQTGLFLNGINSRIYIKHEKGSIGTINGRSFKRTKDCYLLSEISHPSRYTINKTEVFHDKAVNIKIPNKTRALLVRKGKHIFWTHNGGVVDGAGILGFVNNSKPLPEKGVYKDKNDQPNYKNLQIQCLYHLADKINEGGIWIMAELSSAEKEEIKQELDQIQSKDSDNERRLDCKSKADIKADLNRSPDYRDMIFMRVYFDLKVRKQRFMGSRKRGAF